MTALPERFELRLDQETLDAIDNWRSKQAAVPSRSQAIRSLVDKGLGQADDQMRFTSGETMVMWMLADLAKALKAKTEIDPDFVMNALSGGHLWALRWKHQGIFHNHVDSPETVSEVVNILDMWDFIEASFDALSRKERERAIKESGYVVSKPQFHGFDGNNETSHMGVARFLIHDLERFSRFKDRELNSHMPSLGSYRRLFRSFEPMRSTLAGGRLTVSQLIDVLKAAAPPDGRQKP